MTDVDGDHGVQVADEIVRSAFFTMRAQVPALPDAGEGSIVNIASAAAMAGSATASEHCAMKGGVVSATRAAARDYAKLGSA